MCLYIDAFDDWTPLGGGQRTARKAHRCIECNRIIEPGERYEYWTAAMDGRAQTAKMCAHCQATVDLGVALTGCPKQWYVASLYDPSPDIGFVANIVEDEGHDLPRRDRLRMLRCYAAATRRKWRWSDGTLMDVPAVPEAVPA